MSKRYFIVPASRAESGANELWERVVSTPRAETRQRLLVETTSGVARMTMHLLNATVPDGVVGFIWRSGAVNKNGKKLIEAARTKS